MNKLSILVYILICFFVLNCKESEERRHELTTTDLARIAPHPGIMSRDTEMDEDGIESVASVTETPSLSDLFQRAESNGPKSKPPEGNYFPEASACGNSQTCTGIQQFFVEDTSLHYLPSMPISQYSEIKKSAEFSGDKIEKWDQVQKMILADNHSNSEILSALQGVFDKVVDDVHEKLSLENIPKPKLIVLDYADINAWVDYIPVCTNSELGVSVNLKEGDPIEKYDHDNLEFKNTSLSFVANAPAFSTATNQGRTMRCRLEADIDLEELKNELSKSQFEGCSIEKSDSTLFNLKCDHQNLKIFSRQLVFNRTLPYIFFTTPILARLKSLEEFLFVLAHELGHYYQAAGAFRSNRFFDYYYDPTITTKDIYPRRRNDLEDLGQSLFALGKLEMNSIVEGFFSTPISYKFFSLPDAFYVFFDDETGALKGRWERWVTDGIYRGDYWEFNQSLCEDSFRHRLNIGDQNNIKDISSPPTPEIMSKLEKFKKCAETLVSKDGDGANLQSFFRSGVRSKIFNLYKAKMKDDIPLLENRWQAYQYIDRYIAPFFEELFHSEDFEKIGRFTREEGADAFAVQYLKQHGYQAVDAENSIITLLELKIEFSRQNIMTLGIPSPAKCLALYNANWKSDGRKVRVVNNDHSAEHLGSCYRLYNIQRLWGLGNTSELSNKTEFLPNGSEWSKIRTYFQNLSEKHDL